MSSITLPEMIAAISRWDAAHPHPQQKITSHDTRHKTSMWSEKFFLSKKEDGGWDFISLTWYQRIARKIFRAYSSTILTKDEQTQVWKLIDDVVKEKKPPSSSSSTSSFGKHSSSQSPLLPPKSPSPPAPRSSEKSVSGGCSTPQSEEELGVASPFMPDYEGLISATEKLQDLSLLHAVIKIELSTPDLTEEQTQLLLKNDGQLIEKMNKALEREYEGCIISDEDWDKIWAEAEKIKDGNRGEQISNLKKLFNEFKPDEKASTRAFNHTILRNILVDIHGINISEIEKNDARQKDLLSYCLGFEFPEKVKQHPQMKKAEALMGHTNKEMLKIEQANQQELSWPEVLANYQAILKYEEPLNSIPNLIKKAIEDNLSDLKELLNADLIKSGVSPELVKIYLEPPHPSLLVQIIFDHSKMNQTKRSTLLRQGLRTESEKLDPKKIFPDIDSQYNQSIKNLERIKNQLYKQIVMEKIVSSHRIQDNPGKGNCLFYSCCYLTDIFKDYEDARKQIAVELRNPECKDLYSRLIARRIETDREVQHLKESKKQLEDYVNWIQTNYKWGSEPELYAVSHLTQRPVIVVQRALELPKVPYDLSAVINPHFKGEPLLFYNRGAIHYMAFVPKDKTKETEGTKET